MQVGKINGIDCGLTPDEIGCYVTEQIQKRFDQWVSRTKEDPSSFGLIEREALEFSREIAGLIAAAVLSDGKVKEGVEEDAKRIRKESVERRRYVRNTCLAITLLCGLTFSIYTSYWLPIRDRRKAGRPRGVGKRGKEGAGIYPELAALGIREGASAPLREEVSRTTIFMPSFELSRQELSRRGVDLDVKTVRRITFELGEEALSARKMDVQLWREGKFPASDAFKGKRVVVATDGGRVRTRENRPGRKTGKGRHRYETPWREPKLLVIYVVDEKGRRDASEEQVIEIGMQGPEQIAELAAFHLHRLGAAEAKEVVFLADGAEWIWDRVPMIARQAGLVNWLAGVDFYHAMGYVGKAVNATVEGKALRKAHVKKIRQALLDGRFDDALQELQTLPGANGAEEVTDAIRYMKKRRALMKYDLLMAKGLPIGSGAVESGVRRVINLRIKSPGMFWDKDNVESIMYLRANALSGQWESMLKRVYEHTRTTRRRDWKWNLTPYSNKAEDNKKHALTQLVIKEAA